MSSQSKWLLAIIFGGLALITFFMLRNIKTLGNDLPAPNLKAPLTVTPFEDWRPFQGDKGSYFASFPVMPQHAAEYSRDPKTGAQRKYDTYVSTMDNGTIFMVSLITFADDSTEPNEATLKELVNDMVKTDPRNKLIAMKNENFLNKPDISFNIENDQFHIRGLSFYVNKTLYTLTYIATIDNYNEKDYDHFVQNFQLTPPAKK